MSRLNKATRTGKKISEEKKKEEETDVCTGIAYKTVMLIYTCKELARILRVKNGKRRLDLKR